MTGMSDPRPLDEIRTEIDAVDADLVRWMPTWCGSLAGAPNWRLRSDW